MEFDFDILRRLSIMGQEKETRQERGYAPRQTAFDTFLNASLLVGGAILGGRTLLKTNLGMEVMGTIGRGMAKAGHYAREVPRALGSLMAGAEYRSRPLYRNLDLLTDLQGALRDYRNLSYSPGGVPLRTRASRESIVAAARERLASSGLGPRPGVGTFSHVTVADVLADTQLQAGIGEAGLSALQQGMELGMISGETTLTRGITGLFKRGGKVFDTRMYRPSNILRSMYEFGRNFRVPFTQFRPIDVIAAPLRPFGRGEFSGEIAPGLKISKGITAPRAGKSIVIGGQLYNDASGVMLPVEGASGLKLGLASSRPGQAHLERYGRGLHGRNAELASRLSSGAGSWWRRLYDAAQYNLGIGPEFRTRDPFWVEYGVNPYKRRTQGVVVPTAYAPRGAVQGPYDRLAGTLGVDDPAAYLREAVPNTRPVGFFDRVLALIDKSKRAVYVKPGTTGTSASDLVVREKTGAWVWPGSRLPHASDVLIPNKFGQLPTTVPYQHYAYKGSFGETLADVANMMTNRLNDLAGRTFGVGFRPSVGEGALGGLAAAGVNLAKLYGMYAGLTAGVMYAGYADHLVESTTGVSVKKAALSVYAGARLAQQALRDVTGISSGLDYAEDLMPKSVDSGLSWIGRTIAPPVAGLIMGGKGGLLGGLAVAAAIGGTDPSQSPGDLFKEYTGENLVPIRKSRYWLLGRQPFEGGQIDYWAPGWFAREMSDYKYTSTLYGSKDEYYSHVAGIDVPILGSVPLPTPSNMFGLVNLFDGDPLGGGSKYLARKHLYDRPYPDSPGVDQAEAEAAAAYLAARGPYDAPLGAGERLGMGTEGTLGQPPRSRGVLGAASDAVDKISELGGIYKFLAWDYPGFTDRERPAIASASTMSATSRAFYDESMGGMFGLNELYRRFVPPDPKGINPMVNTMPEWLPGARSAFTVDRNFHIDFTLGDPYAKLKMGEFRLPGEAYERLHKLHSGVSGIYDPVDRFLILADVAPASYAFKEYKAIVDGWMKAGVLDDYWRDKIKTTNLQVKQKMEKYQFVHRRFTGLTTDPDPEATAARYTPLEQALGAGWEILTHDLIPKMGDTIPVLGPMVSNKLLVARSPVEQYLRNEVYGEEFADWRSPWNAFLRPKFNQMGADDTLSASLSGLGFFMFGANPLAAATLGVVGTTTGAALSSHGQPYVPGHRRDEWELQEYLDNLRFVKSEMLHNRALSMGDQELASYFQSEVNRTAAGMDYQGGTQQYISRALRALPSSMKSYFMPFMEMPVSAQREVLPYLPEHLQPIFASSWARPKDADLSFARELNRGYGDVFRTSPNDRAAQYFEQNPLPSPDWSGWHPDVPLDAIKIKMVDAGVNSVAADIHKFDLFPEHRFRASRFESLEPVQGDFSHVSPDPSSEADLFRTLERAGFSGIMIRQGIPRAENIGVNWRTRYDRRRDMQPYVRDAFR